MRDALAGPNRLLWWALSQLWICHGDQRSHQGNCWWESPWFDITHVLAPPPPPKKKVCYQSQSDLWSAKSSPITQILLVQNFLLGIFPIWERDSFPIQFTRIQASGWFQQMWGVLSLTYNTATYRGMFQERSTDLLCTQKLLLWMRFLTQAQHTYSLKLESNKHVISAI